MNPTTRRAIALVISAVLAALDVAGLAALGVDGAPPPALALTAAALGVITFGATVPALRGSRRGVQAVVVSRVLSAALGLPVFFVSDAPAWAPPAVVGALVLTTLAVWLLLPFARTATRLVAAGQTR
jgi:hypothetical protein